MGKHVAVPNLWGQCSKSMGVGTLRERGEQHLIDIMFEIVMTLREHPHMLEDREKLAEWVADQLRKCGYPTVPMGMSWGVLTK
jgi:hypothetical protein